MSISETPTLPSKKHNFDRNLRKDVVEHTGHYNRPVDKSDATIKYLGSIAPEGFESLISQKESRGFDGRENSLFNYLFNLIDTGLIEPKHIHDPQTYRKTSFAPVAMYNRSSLFLETNKKIFDDKGEYLQGKDLTILNIDLGNLRSADKIQDPKDPEGNHFTYADILIQETCRAINELVENIDSYIDLPKDVAITTGRYGGDEFMLTHVGNLSEEKKLELKSLLSDRIQLINAFYQDPHSGSTERLPAQIKNNTIEEYNLPQEGLQRDIYLHYLRQSLVFGEEQIESILNKYRAGDEVDETKLREDLSIELKNNNIYGKDDLSVQEKLKFLYDKYPEDAIMLARAYNYDKNRPDSNTSQAILSIIENVLYDTLLRDRVQGFTRFKKDIEGKKYDHIWGFDMKFIKEINDSISYADADLAIKELWKNISKGIQPEDRNKLIFTRKGGTFFVGLKKGEEVGLDTQLILESLNSVNILKTPKNPEGTDIPIGRVNMDLSTLESNSMGTREVIVDLFDTMDSSMYSNLINYIMEAEYQSEIDSQDLYSFKSLVHKFFTGKRQGERLGKLKYFIDNNKFGYTDSTFQDLILEGINYYYRNTKKEEITHPEKEESVVEFLQDGIGFDFNQLEKYNESTFDEYSDEVQLAVILSAKDGPKTIKSLSKFFDGHVGKYIPQDKLKQYISRYRRVEKGNPSHVYINDWAKNNIQNLLEPNNKEVRRKIEDFYFHDLDYQEPLDFEDYPLKAQILATLTIPAGLQSASEITNFLNSFIEDQIDEHVVLEYIQTLPAIPSDSLDSHQLLPSFVAKIRKKINFDEFDLGRRIFDYTHKKPDTINFPEGMDEFDFRIPGV